MNQPFFWTTWTGTRIAVRFDDFGRSKLIINDSVWASAYFHYSDYLDADFN